MWLSSKVGIICWVLFKFVHIPQLGKFSLEVPHMLTRLPHYHSLFMPNNYSNWYLFLTLLINDVSQTLFASVSSRIAIGGHSRLCSPTILMLSYHTGVHVYHAYSCVYVCTCVCVFVLFPPRLSSPPLLPPPSPHPSPLTPRLAILSNLPETVPLWVSL